jgi:hypothetical protein
MPGAGASTPASLSVSAASFARGGCVNLQKEIYSRAYYRRQPLLWGKQNKIWAFGGEHLFLKCLSCVSTNTGTRGSVFLARGGLSTKTASTDISASQPVGQPTCSSLGRRVYKYMHASFADCLVHARTLSLFAGVIT